MEFGPILVRQDCGIPIGISPAPFMADLNLAFYELRFLTQHVPSLAALAACLATVDDQPQAALGAAFSATGPLAPAPPPPHRHC